MVDDPLRLNAKERSILLSYGYDPEKWVSSRMLAGKWGVSKQHLRVIDHRGQVPGGEILGSTKFFPRSLVFDVLPPTGEGKEERKEEKKKEMRSLGNEPASKVPAWALNKKERTQATYLRMLSERVTPEDWVQIIDRALHDAKLGDYKARSWLSNYLIGTPIKRIAAMINDTSSQRFTQAERARALQSILSDAVEEEGGDDGGNGHEGPDNGVVEVPYTDSQEAS